MWWLILACTPSVQRAPAQQAEVYCDRAEECALLQDGERAESCVPGTTDAFDDIWTTELCPDGFDRDAWKACSEAIESWECDDLTYGWAAIGEACSSRTVCP